MLDRFPEQVFVDRAENFIGEVHRADLAATQIEYVDGCHCFLLFREFDCSLMAVSSQLSALSNFAQADS
jgi:hypothetical protein